MRNLLAVAAMAVFSTAAVTSPLWAVDDPGQGQGAPVVAGQAPQGPLAIAPSDPIARTAHHHNVALVQIAPPRLVLDRPAAHVTLER